MLYLMTDLKAPVGWQRRVKPDTQGRKWDRRSALYYGAVRRPAGRFWAAAETFVLSHNLFLGAVLDGDEATAAAIQDRPQLKWLLSEGVFEQALGGGGVIVGNINTDLADNPVLKAVVARFLVGKNVPLYTWLSERGRGNGYRVVTERLVTQWEQQANSPRIIAETIEQLDEAQHADLLPTSFWASFFAQVTDRHAAPSYHGDGPQRDTTQARDDALLRREHRRDGWTDQRIRDYLEIYGYTNPSGTVGRWGHAQFQRLLTEQP